MGEVMVSNPAPHPPDPLAVAEGQITRAAEPSHRSATSPASAPRAAWRRPMAAMRPTPKRNGAWPIALRVFLHQACAIHHISIDGRLIARRVDQAFRSGAYNICRYARRRPRDAVAGITPAQPPPKPCLRLAPRQTLSAISSLPDGRPTITPEVPVRGKCLLGTSTWKLRSAGCRPFRTRAVRPATFGRGPHVQHGSALSTTAGCLPYR